MNQTMRFISRSCKIAVERELHRARHRAVERIDGAVEFAQSEGIARRRIGGGDRRRIGAGLVDEARHHGRRRRG